MKNNEYDLEMMVKDLAEVRAKYGLPKTIGLVPDRIEVTIDRKDLDKFEVNYSEYFNYLPQNVLSQALQDTVNMLMQLGVNPENITTSEKGVHTVSNGDFSVLMYPLSEILFQHYNIEKDMDWIFECLKVTINTFLSMIESRYVFDNETEREIEKIRSEYNEKIFENPNIMLEIHEIMEKFKSSMMKFFSQL